MPFAQQSPINLNNPIRADLKKERLAIKWTGKIHGEVFKDEHGVRIQFFPNARTFVRLGNTTYGLAEFHFHHPSEHLINGTPQTMELHVVHRNVNDGAQFCVIGIFLEVAGTATQPKVAKFIHKVHEILLKVAAGEAVDCRVSVSPKIFLPPKPTQYYRYEGSLTTGEFDEAVSWVIMRNPIRLNPIDLTDLIGEFKKTARNPQPLNRRFVLSTF